jgi:hypothetical protein
MATAANSPEQNRNIHTQRSKGQTGLFIGTNPTCQSTPGLIHADSLQPGESTAPHRPLWARPFEYWHLLSLDAPTVAALWAWFFARAMRVELPWHAPLLLALGTWLIYVADRLLDGAHRNPATPLQQRHLFHRKHRRAFLAAALAAACLLLWLIVMRMTASARREDTVLFAAALLYLVLVHKPRAGAANWLPKELAVGIVFAAATAVPAWSRIDGAGRRALLPGVSLFALLCWLNCVAIERWENLSPSATSETPEVHLTTHWAANHFRTVALILAGVSAIAAIAAILRIYKTADMYIAISLTAVCLALTDLYRENLAGLHRRIAADAVLLTPLLFLPFLS